MFNAKILLIGHDLYFTDYPKTMITFIVQILQLTEGNHLANKFCSSAIATLNKKNV